MAWYQYDRWARVLTYSGTFVDRTPDTNPHGDPNGAVDYWKVFVPTSPPKPLRVACRLRSNDLNLGPDQVWTVANRGMDAALVAKGYHVRFAFAQNVGHEYSDRAAWHQTLPGDLEWLWAQPLPP